MADNWKTFVGVVQFDPTPREVNGKDVLNIAVRPTGVKEQSFTLSATLWPSHKELFDSISKGTVVALEGKFSVKKGEEKNYYNLSVSGIAILGQLDLGERVETTDDDAGDPDDESW